MKKNMGTADRTIRTALAVLLLILILADVITGTLGVILGIVAAMFLLTSAMGFCPLYLPLKISTVRASTSGDR